MRPCASCKALCQWISPFRGPLRKIEKSNAVVGGHNLIDDRACRVVNAVTDKKYLKILEEIDSGRWQLRNAAVRHVGAQV